MLKLIIRISGCFQIVTVSIQEEDNLSKNDATVKGENKKKVQDGSSKVAFFRL